MSRNEARETDRTSCSFKKYWSAIVRSKDSIPKAIESHLRRFNFRVT